MLEPERHTLGSQDTLPSLNFSQVGETISMLALTVAQIETSMKEGDQSVNQLTDSFTDLASHSQEIIKEAQKLDKNIPHEAEIRRNMLLAAEGLSEKIQKAVIAFQFYDRLTQRLDHASHSLEKIGHLIADSGERYQEEAWRNVQDNIKNSYTMEAERIMFEHIMRGHSVAEALEIYQHQFKKDSEETFDTDDDIELF
jgi:Inhibitor of growth proteins N-terminal histone-binding